MKLAFATVLGLILFAPHISSAYRLSPVTEKYYCTTRAPGPLVEWLAIAVADAGEPRQLISYAMNLKVTDAELGDMRKVDAYAHNTVTGFDTIGADREVQNLPELIIATDKRIQIEVNAYLRGTGTLIVDFSKFGKFPDRIKKLGVTTLVLDMSCEKNITF